MSMKRQQGFTLIELMVAVAIVGVLMATAVPVYRTWQQRAYGSEALIMAKQIIDAEISYYLENDKFFPSINNPPVAIRHDDTSESPDVKAVFEKIHINIPTGHFLDYDLVSYINGDGIEQFQVTISSHGAFEILKDQSEIAYTVNKNGLISTGITP